MFNIAREIFVKQPSSANLHMKYTHESYNEIMINIVCAFNKRSNHTHSLLPSIGRMVVELGREDRNARILVERVVGEGALARSSRIVKSGGEEDFGDYFVRSTPCIWVESYLRKQKNDEVRRTQWLCASWDDMEPMVGAVSYMFQFSIAAHPSDSGGLYEQLRRAVDRYKNVVSDHEVVCGVIEIDSGYSCANGYCYTHWSRDNNYLKQARVLEWSKLLNEGVCALPFVGVGIVLGVDMQRQLVERAAKLGIDVKMLLHSDQNCSSELETIELGRGANAILQSRKARQLAGLRYDDIVQFDWSDGRIADILHKCKLINKLS